MLSFINSDDVTHKSKTYEHNITLVTHSHVVKSFLK